MSRDANPIQTFVLNPLDKLAFRLGAPPAGDALLETIGRRTGEPRTTPVCEGLVGETFWIITQRGARSGYVKNIEVEPRVRVKARGTWRAGTAHILEDDDPGERRLILGRGNFARDLCLRASRAMGGGRPLTIRIDLAPVNGDADATPSDEGA